jgi:hypothetical protein
VTAKSASSDESRQGWIQSSTCRAVNEAGRTAGREYGLAETTARELARLLSRQARDLFGRDDPAGQATFDGLARAFACGRLEELADRLLVAPDWAEWLAGVAVPPPAPGPPDYTKDLEIDLEPSGPSIDTYTRAPLVGGGEAIIHIRIQKWYQPDLDRYLYHESRKVERRLGKMPIVCVFLLWPPAEGPGMTGRFRQRDAWGRVKRTFTYTIKRAWELTPEEVTHSPRTVMMAPLSKGAKERMPEIVQMVKNGLDQCRADAMMRQMAWEAFYWSMGLVCDLDEAHRALGDMLPLIQQCPNSLSAKGHAFQEAYASAQVEGPLQAARVLILRQATRRFGERPGAADVLAAVTTREELQELARRVLTAPDWSGLLGRP